MSLTRCFVDVDTPASWDGSGAGGPAEKKLGEHVGGQEGDEVTDRRMVEQEGRVERAAEFPFEPTPGVDGTEGGEPEFEVTHPERQHVRVVHHQFTFELRDDQGFEERPAFGRRSV